MINWVRGDGERESTKGPRKQGEERPTRGRGTEGRVEVFHAGSIEKENRAGVEKKKTGEGGGP